MKNKYVVEVHSNSADYPLRESDHLTTVEVSCAVKFGETVMPDVYDGDLSCLHDVIVRAFALYGTRPLSSVSLVVTCVSTVSGLYTDRDHPDLLANVSDALTDYAVEVLVSSYSKNSEETPSESPSSVFSVTKDLWENVNNVGSQLLSDYARA